MFSAFIMTTEMYDYLYGSLLYVVDALYIITFIVAILNYNKYRQTPLKYLPILLLLTIVFEFFGKYLAQVMPGHANNSVVYNSYHILAFCFYYIIIRNYISNVVFKKWINIFLVLFLLTSVLNPFYEDFLKRSQIIAYVVLSLIHI